MLAFMVWVLLATSDPAGVSLTIDANNRSIEKDARPLLPHIGGRVAASPQKLPAPKGSWAYYHQWPAVYWEAAFIGDKLFLKFDDDKNEYRLTIDGTTFRSIPQPGRVELLVKGLGSGRHHVRLDKLTESVDFVRAFNGFFIPRGETAFPPPNPRPRQIEFIGDSGMTGYGVRSDTRICTKEEIRLRSDSSAAWPSIVAHSIDADYQVNAISGIGLVRDFSGVTPKRVMSALYPFTLPNAPQEWRDPSWHPQVVVILLFNDFGTELRLGERWPDRAALVADYVRAYRHLIGTIHRRSPGTNFILPWPNLEKSADVSMKQFSASAQADIRSAAVNAGVTRIDFPLLPDFKPENSACDYHGSRNDHRRLAQWMTAWLNDHPKLWKSSNFH